MKLFYGQVIHNESDYNRNKNTINVFFHIQMHSNCIRNERAITFIIHRYITPVDNKNCLRFIIDNNKKLKVLTLDIINNSSRQENKNIVTDCQWFYPSRYYI